MKFHSFVKQVALMTFLLVGLGLSSVNASDDINVTRIISVGSSEESAFIREMYEKYPDSKPQLDSYRKKASELPYGTKIEMHFLVQNGVSDINWKEVTVGAAAGVGAALLWNAFGGEILCAVGFAPMCACVGPQC